MQSSDVCSTTLVAEYRENGACADGAVDVRGAWLSERSRFLITRRVQLVTVDSTGRRTDKGTWPAGD